VKQQLLYLKSLAERSPPLPRGVRNSREALFYEKAREFVPALVIEVLELRETREKLEAELAKHVIDSKRKG
jgi:hypothetical protein